MLGIWSEETDGLYTDDKNDVLLTIDNLKDKSYKAIDICDIIHTEIAQTIGVYENDFYADYPALTVNTFGAGKAYYIAFRNNCEFEKDFYSYLMKNKF